jgi:hypothetical protein
MNEERKKQEIMLITKIFFFTCDDKANICAKSNHIWNKITKIEFGIFWNAITIMKREQKRSVRKQIILRIIKYVEAKYA